MYLFTWNLQKSKPLAQIALCHLERVMANDNVVASFQEWPVGMSPPKGLQVLATSSKAVIACSSQLKCVVGPEVDSSGRATIVRLQVNPDLELNCVGVHWHSRVSVSELGDDPYRRGGAAALFRHHLDTVLQSKFKGCKQTVIMGDFNSPSEHRSEIEDEYCFFSSGATNRRPASSTVMGVAKDEWYGGELDVEEDLGTHYWRTRKRWQIFDHIFVTPDLRTQVSRPYVLTGLLDTSSTHLSPFLTPQRIPRGPKYSSDHLPVTCVLQYNP